MYTLNLDAITASYDIKYARDIIKLVDDNNSQNEMDYPQNIFSLERTGYETLNNFKIIFSSNFLDLIYQHNILPQESTFAAIRVSIIHLNLLINVTLATYPLDIRFFTVKFVPLLDKL